ncbi:MAG TPA: MFS transporter, partial [bacterium]|nr:MFS transporter [bacterium]
MAGRRSVLFACSLLQFLVIGAQYTFPVLYLRIVEEFGAMRAAVSGVQSTVFLVETAAFVGAGLLVDRYRPRQMITLGLALMAAGLGAAAGARALWQLYVTLGVIATAGAPLVKIGVAIVLTEVFAPRRRGLAFGLAYAANGLAEAAFFPVVDALARAWGWRAAYGVIGAALALVGLPAARVIL